MMANPAAAREESTCRNAPRIQRINECTVQSFVAPWYYLLNHYLVLTLKHPDEGVPEPFAVVPSYSDRALKSVETIKSQFTLAPVEVKHREPHAGRNFGDKQTL